jgi:hypothetical protein
MSNLKFKYSLIYIRFEKELLQRLSEQKIITLHSKMNKMLKLFCEVETNKSKKDT